MGNSSYSNDFKGVVEMAFERWSAYAKHEPLKTTSDYMQGRRAGIMAIFEEVLVLATGHNPADGLSDIKAIELFIQHCK